MTQPPYNPLAKPNLADSVMRALLDQPLQPLPSTERRMRKSPPPPNGAGVYAIYYRGPFEPYRTILERADRELGEDPPIYVGRATPKGSRKGGMSTLGPLEPVLWERLREHARSLDEATNLELADFECRMLFVDDIFIPLGEHMLIERFHPIWNERLDGFGNHDPGGRRTSQWRSPWDTVHPGRRWAPKLGDRPETAADILETVARGGIVLDPANLDVEGAEAD